MLLWNVSQMVCYQERQVTRRWRIAGAMIDVHVEPQVKGFQYNIFIYLLLILSDCAIESSLWMVNVAGCMLVGVGDTGFG